MENPPLSGSPRDEAAASAPAPKSANNEEEESSSAPAWEDDEDEGVIVESVVQVDNDSSAAAISPLRTNVYSSSGDELDGIMKKPSIKQHRPPRKKLQIPRLRKRRIKHRNIDHQYDSPVNSFDADVEDDDDDDDKDADDTVTGNWSIDETPDKDDQHRTASGNVRLTATDIAICQALDEQYERAIEDRQVAWTARYQSVRQSTLISVIFMVVLIIFATMFFLRQADSYYWSVPEGLLFTIYTMTTVGYGHLDMPSSASFQLYTIFFIFIGIAMLTILVAQIYQCIALEASRVADGQRRNNHMRQWLDQQVERQRRHNADRASGGGGLHDSSVYEEPMLEKVLHYWDCIVTFLRDNEFGRGLSVVLPFAILIALGAAVLGPLEGWSVVESLYFAVVSLTTVGFGDYYPTKKLSICFCCLWLPFSVGFMSLYLANIAAFYIRLSDRNVARIERVLRRRLQRMKERAEQERRAVLRRAMRGQEVRSFSQCSGTSSDDDPLVEVNPNDRASLDDVEQGVTVVTVDHSSAAAAAAAAAVVVVDPHNNTDRLRQTANRLRGYMIPTSLEEDSNHDDDGCVASSNDPESNRHARPKTTNSTRHLFGTEGSASNRRERILHNSLKHTEFFTKEDGTTATSPHHEQQRASSTTMATMNDVLRAVHRNNSLKDIVAESDSGHGRTLQFQAGPESEFLSVQASRNVLHHDRRTVHKKPSFALRALVQERFAEIIAADIAGYQSSIEIKEYTLSVTIQSLKQTADKWLVPRRARKAFRAVAFEALYFVGEHGLITRGADALFSLTPFEFHQIFSPLLAAFGDAETMELWLAHTQALADVDLGSDPQRRLSGPSQKRSRKVAARKLAPSQQQRNNEVDSQIPHDAAKATQAPGGEQELPQIA